MHSSLFWERKVLSNGLTVLFYPRPTGLTAQLSVGIKYGSSDDSKENAGRAHFLEHMIVGGSQERIKLHNQIEHLGGCSNLESSDEYTLCTVDIFSGKIAQASKILSRLLYDMSFEREKLELERKVILNEIAEADDNPRDKVTETLLKCLFKHHPVRNPVLGSKKTVNQLTLGDIEKAHQNYYTPQHMILILTGNFSTNDAKTVLQDFQNRINSNSQPKQNNKNEKNTPKKTAIIERPGITQAYLSFGFQTPPAKNPDVPTLDLIDAVLGIGESSRLFVELREKRALTYDFKSINMSGLDYGYFSVDCAVKTKALSQTQAIIRKELTKLKTHPVSQSELVKSKNLILGSIYRAIDNPRELPRILANMEIHFENEKALLDYINKIDEISEPNITEAANKYFQEENYSTVTLIPKKL
jgi:predicted Zn-dependent peptidase